MIELLVVIAIIGLLSSVVLSSLNGARKKGRDARRMADLKQIQVAQELYYGAQTVPAYSTTIAGLVTAGMIPSEPKDPQSGASYSIAVNGTQFYCVGASMETTPLPISSCNTGSTGLNAVPSGANYWVGP